jgi:hypothetical protein
MIKKLLVFLIVVSVLIGADVFAQNDQLPNPGVTPDSTFYFLETWAEGIRTFFTFGDVAKAKRYTNLASERIAEAKEMIEKDNSKATEKALTRYEDHLDRALAHTEKAKQKDLDTEEVMTLVSEATLKHQYVLADVYEKVPEQAKDAIQKAMEKSMKGYEEALKAISGEKKEEMKPKGEEIREKVEGKLKGKKEEIEIPEEIPQPPEEIPAPEPPTTP